MWTSVLDSDKKKCKFNLYKYKTPFKYGHTNFVVRLFHFKLIAFIFYTICMSFQTIVVVLIFKAISDNFAIQVLCLIIPVIAVYKIFDTKLLKISYFPWYCLV